MRVIEGKFWEHDCQAEKTRVRLRLANGLCPWCGADPSKPEIVKESKPKRGVLGKGFDQDDDVEE